MGVCQMFPLSMMNVHQGKRRNGCLAEIIKQLQKHLSSVSNIMAMA